jgi:multidrug efflux pump subunit AcrB
MVELVPSDSRSVRNRDFIRAWREAVPPAPGLESLTIASRIAGHPGRAIDVQLSGAEPPRLKAAAEEVRAALTAMPGVSAVEDNMPWGREQLVYRLTPQGEALGLSVEAVGRQLRAAYDGHLAQIFHEAHGEVEVRTLLPDAERDRAARLADLHVVLPDGSTAPLPTVVTLEPRRGFEVLRRAQGDLAVQVFADVDRAVANENDVRAALEAGVLAELRERHGIESSFEGKASDQRETLADMRQGGLLALVLIYLVLAWVFSSYGWPLVIMAIIPFGLVGAVAGHWVMGIDLTILSLFGLFGLSGIVVNDSIILLTFYRQLREAGHGVREAVVEAACRRLRAVLLTSLTTIAGLTPLLFETSLQAQFLIPMAVSISFGLAFATLLVLLVIPALLTVHEQAAERLAGGPARTVADSGP